MNEADKQLSVMCDIISTKVAPITGVCVYVRNRNFTQKTYVDFHAIQ